jgi:prepilin-type N-terminal cleavage/methylation domain-containing protein
MLIFNSESPRTQKQAFSLVELSIVLVILGLLTGGILTGQSLIRAAELRAITTESDQFSAAVNAFKAKYFALPGDMNNATSFWGVNTANGNGDGIIDSPSAASTAGEMFMFWNQLGLSGLINGQYTGIAGSIGIWNTIYGTNTPQSKISGTGYMIITANYSGGDSYLYAYNYINSLIYGAQEVGGNSWTGNESLKPEEAWNIDKKIDDGIPSRGRLHAMNWQWGCSVANSGALASDNFDMSYNLSNQSKSCAFIFHNMFQN